jgi:hypothetical protein
MTAIEYLLFPRVSFSKTKITKKRFVVKKNNFGTEFPRKSRLSWSQLVSRPPDLVSQSIFRVNTIFDLCP